MNLYHRKASHIVVNDMNPLKFGHGGESYWRSVIGCQAHFSASGRYLPTEDLEWNLPSIWTCNHDLDPRNFPAVREYLESTKAIIIDIDGTPLL